MTHLCQTQDRRRGPATPWRNQRVRRRERGFTYLGLLFFVAVIGAGLAAAGEVWHASAQRERERELLFVGAQFRQAIGSYYETSPGVKRYPRRLEDLLADDRTAVVRRHLRRIYLDPMTGKADWGLIVQGDQILGIHSQSKAEPIKRANFAAGEAFFAESRSYADWRFVYAPQGAPSAGVAALAADKQALRAESDRTLPPLSVPRDDDGATSPASADSASASQPQGAANATLPTEGWACTAAHANTLRACDKSAPTQGADATQRCKKVAEQQYGRCLSAASGTGSLFGTQ